MTEHVSSKARLGKGVDIGPFTVIHDDVEIADDVIIGSHCVIGLPTSRADGPLRIGPGSHIRSHSVIYQGAEFGSGLVTGHGVLVREGARCGVCVQIGSRSEVEGPCNIGDYVRIHSSVHVSESSLIGDFVWLFPRVQFTNDPFPPSDVRKGVSVGDMAVVATGAVLLPGVHLGEGSFVGASSVVRKDVPDIHCVSGDPARVFATLDRFFDVELGFSYPWPKHFRRGYPEEAIGKMEEIAERIERLKAERPRA